LDALSAPGLEPDKYKVLTNLVSSQVYRNFADVEDYDSANGTLKELYVKPKNTIAVRHELLTCKQLTGESIDNFVVRLKRLSQECECQAVSAERYGLELMRDALTGIQSQVIRQRLLEERALSFEDAFRKARAMELAFKNSEAYQGTTCSARLVETQEQRGDDDQDMADSNHLRAGSVKQPCYFCGNARHPRQNCPAKDAVCNFCQKVGHYFKACQKRLGNRSIDATKKTAGIQGPKLATLSTSETSSNTPLLCNVKMNGIVAKFLKDTGSSNCYIDRRFAEKHSFNIRRAVGEVTLAETSVRVPIRGQCVTHLLVENNEYSDATFNALDNLATDVILGEKIFKRT